MNPRWLSLAALLVVVLPLLGVLLVWRLRRWEAGVARQVATVSALVTAIATTGLVAATLMDAADSPPLTTAIRWLSVPGVGRDVPWLTVALTFAIDRLNAVPLLVIAWLTVSVIGVSSRAVSAWELSGLLAWEAAWLAAFLAQDAITFWIAAEWCALLAWAITVGFGETDRRPAAGKLWRHQIAANALILTGLIGLTVVGAWMQREVSSRPTVLTGRWQELTELTPRLALASADPAQTWQTVAMGLLLLLLAGAWIRSGLIPIHGWWTMWLSAAPVSAAVIGVVAWPLLAVYTLQRCVLPVFPLEWPAVSSTLGALGAATAVWGGLLVLAQTDLRKFAAAIGVSLTGLMWLGLSSSDPASREAVVMAGLASSLGLAGYLMWLGVLDQRHDTHRVDGLAGLTTRLPRLAALLCGLLLGVFGIPALARLAHEPAVLVAIGRRDPIAIAAWAIAMLLVGWSSIWLIQRIAFDRSPEPRSEARPFSDGAASPQIIDVDSSPCDLTLWESVAFLPVVAGILLLTGLAWTTNRGPERAGSEQPQTQESP